jgi:ABC-2 type transport system ATP-binding protein
MTSALSLRGVGKDYGRRVAVAAIDLEVGAGELVGLLGPNGAGKTTTIAMACGALTPSRGRIAIAGIDLRTSPRAARARLGYVPQELALYGELSLLQNLRYFGALYGLRGAALERRIAWALELVALADRAGDRVKELSGGMQRRLNLAASLLHRPELLILDEPTAGVDPQSRAHLFETLRALHADGMAMVYTSHHLEEVELLCQRVAILDHGALLAVGTPAELARAHAGDVAGPASRLEAAFLALTGSALRDAS